MNSDRKPIGEVLQGIDIIPLEEGTVALDAIVIVKTMDPAGDMGWSVRYTGNQTSLEIAAICHAMGRREDKNFDDNWTVEATE